jgi:1-hydroxycarotenoid 3,4-desaturase
MPLPRVLIIGAGVGGLAAGADAARFGLDVTILEKGDAPGGKMAALDVDGHRVDSGPTVFTMRPVFEALFAENGQSLAERVKLRPLDILARHAWSADEQLDLCADLQRSAENIGKFCGVREARGFLDFCDRAKAIFIALDRTFMQAQRPSPVGLMTASGLSGLPGLMRISPFTSLLDALGKYFQDPRLRQLFGRYATYCGSSPFLAPATLMLIAHAEQDGVWSVDGGMSCLAQAMAGLAQSQGAQIRYGCSVSSIGSANGKIDHIITADGERIAADAVVFNGDAAALSSGLLGHGPVSAVPTIDRANRSLSAITWSAVARTSGFPLTRHNVFFSRDYRAEFDDIFKRAKVPGEPTVYVCAQDRIDDEDHAEGEERLLILINAPPAGDRRAELEIEQCRERTLKQLARCGLRVTLSAERTIARTPQDFQRSYPGTGGALYGQASHGWMASFRRPGTRTTIPGLYLAGGSVHPGPGIPMAALSGRLAIQALMQDLASTARSRRTAMRGGIPTR